MATILQAALMIVVVVVLLKYLELASSVQSRRRGVIDPDSESGPRPVDSDGSSVWRQS